MSQTIVCGVDGSELGTGAAAVAGALAGRLALPVVFVHVLDRQTPEKLTAASALLAREIASARPPHGSIPVVEIGHAADRLVDAARRHRAALLVVGSHGPRSSLLGSVSVDASRRSPCPVVVVPPGAPAGLVNGESASFVTGGLVRFDV